MGILETQNIVVISDTHCGCKLALYPKKPVKLDEGGAYRQSPLQRKLWGMWENFWEEFVPHATRGEPYCVVHNGDAIDGVHHNSTSQISHDLGDQSRIAYECLAPIVEKCEGRYFHIRGTEAHVGKSGREEEALAEKLGAIPNSLGQYARYDLWKQIGESRLVHLLHHIGTTGSQAYEATAVGKELTEELIESARWGRKIPDICARSHRHRYIGIQMAKQDISEKHDTGMLWSFTTPCWQGKTSFAWKIAGARLSTPQFGGVIIRWSDDELFIRPRVWTVDRSRTE